MMTNLMRNHIRLRKVSGRVKPSPQFFIERQIDVDLLIARTVERTNSGARHSTRRLHAIRKQDQRRLAILTSILLEQVVPNVLRFSKDHRYVLLQLILFRTNRARALHTRRRIGRHLFEQLPRISAEDQRDDDYQHRAKPAANSNLPSGKSPPVLNIRTLPFASPPHARLPPRIFLTEISKPMCRSNDTLVIF